MTWPEAMATDCEAHPGAPAELCASATERFGGFAVGEMRLALPLAALVEVVPASSLISLPCAVPAVTGGLAFRGGVVPVIELQRALGQGTEPPGRDCVLLVQQAGRMLGLAVDRALGVFEPARDSRPQRMEQPQGDGAAWLLGSVEVVGEAGPLLLLSLAALFEIPGLPATLVQDVGLGSGAVPQPALSLMVVRSQGVRMAIDALAVQGTMPAPVLRASPLARGHCRGVLDAEAGPMPIVDLLSLLGLGRTEQGPGSQAFSLLVGRRLLGLLVDEVLEIASVAAADLAPLAPQFLAPGCLLAGALAAKASAGPADGGQTCYVLDAAALADHPELKALAEVSGAMPPGSASAADSQALPGRLTEMLVYEAGMTAATPLGQVEEILAPMAPGARLAGQAPLLGLVVHRGHGIPVFCLASLLNGQQAGTPSQGCVLVVLRADGRRIGFAVPQLSFIGRARWKTSLGPSARQSGHLARAALSGELALFGGSGGSPERMVPVIDLRLLAGELGQDEAHRQEEHFA